MTILKGLPLPPPATPREEIGAAVGQRRLRQREGVRGVGRRLDAPTEPVHGRGDGGLSDPGGHAALLLDPHGGWPRAGAHRRAGPGALTPPTPPGTPRRRLRQPGCPPLRCGAPTSAPRCAIPAQLPPAPRTPLPRLPGGGPRARRHHDTGHRCPPECPGPRATPGPPAPDPRHPTAAPRPSPCGLAPLPPARRGGPRQAWARRDGRARLAPRPRPAWPHTHGETAHLSPPLRGHTCGQARSPRPPPVAGTRGPAGPRGPPAGHGARGTAPQAGHTRCGPCSARRPGGLGGRALPCGRHGVGASPETRAGPPSPGAGVRPTTASPAATGRRGRRGPGGPGRPPRGRGL
jgi:hypothetical protein